MISEKMKELIGGGSAIRAMFEEGKRLAAEYGRENVYDFSLGNPSTQAPDAVKEAAVRIVQTEDSLTLHGYMSNSGFEDVRAAVAAHLQAKYGVPYTARHIVMTVGAAGGLNVLLKSMLDPCDEVIVFAPYFGEYRHYVDNFGARIVEVAPNPPTFLPDPVRFAAAITARTKAVIVNSPNNPTGVVYGKDTLKELARILRQKQREYGKPIYLISDEPYREIAYYGQNVPYVPDFYENTVVAYSYSKSLSLPGERIGYLAITPACADADELIEACGVATRILGFVNAPSLQQKIVAQCLACEVDIAAYERNRALLCACMDECGLQYVSPQGAFYLWVKSPIADEKEFCRKAKEYRILIVPGSSFGCAGYVRIAYCVAQETIERAAPQFRKLARQCAPSRSES